MPKKKQHNQAKTATDGDEDDDASMDRASVDDEVDLEDANMAHLDHSANILAAIHLMRADFSTQLREVVSSNQEIKEAIGAFSERLTTAESRISKAEDDISGLTGKEKSLQKKVQELTLKLDDLENRHRRSNLRLIGLPEKTEGGDAVAFLQTWLPEVLGPDTFPRPVVIERAHRLPGRRDPSGPPRTLIMKFLNYQDKVRVMSAARKKGKVMYREHQIMFFPDLSVEVQKQRCQYNDVKLKLRALHLDFGLIFPAKMKIFHKGSRHQFNTPEEVEAFIQQIRQQQEG